MARSFNGSSDSATTAVSGSSLLTAAAGAFSLWVIMAGAAPPFGSYGGGGILCDLGGFWGLFQSTDSGTDQIDAFVWDGASKHCGSTYSQNVWTHFVWNHTGGILYLYKNGVQQSTVTAGNITNLSAHPSLGVGSGGEFFHGIIAEVGMWNAALSAPEITALALGTLPFNVMPGSLTAYWPLWGLQSPEIDLTFHAHSMTLTGTAAANHAPVVPFSSLFGNDFSPATAPPTATRPLTSLFVPAPPVPLVNK